jgi:hypothetical protein
MRILLLMALVGCTTKDISEPSDTGTDSDSGVLADDPDTDTDADADADADSDLDGDLDGDSGGAPDVDADDPGDIDCEEDIDVEVQDTCVSGPLNCGESLVSTTIGGLSESTGVEYSSWFCAVVGSDSYTGPERVYRFDHPGTGNATIELESPCGELDVFAAFWSDDTCPTADHSVGECEGDVGAGDGSITIWNSSPRSYLVYVDGPDGAEANFGLSATCE